MIFEHLANFSDAYLLVSIVLESLNSLVLRPTKSVFIE